MGNTTQQKKKPSYLSKIKNELLEFIVADLGGNRQAAEEITEKLWSLVRKWTTKSYYNGVRDGASGKVKPKTATNS